MSDLVVRAALPAEYAAVGELTVSGYATDGHLTLPDGSFDHQYATWIGDAATRGREGDLLVAVDAGELLGTVTWCPPGSPYRELAVRDHQGEIRTLSVSPDARGRGVGRLLVVDCLRRALELGLSEIVLCSLPSMTTAHRLYGSLGFVRRPDLDWSPKPDVPLWGFSLDLARSSTSR